MWWLWSGHSEGTLLRTTELRSEAPLRPGYSDPTLILQAEVMWNVNNGSGMRGLKEEGQSYYSKRNS